MGNRYLSRNSKLSCIFHVFLLTCLMLSLSGPLAAQSNTGRLLGTVVDAQGGVIPGVTITLMDNQTKRERQLISDDVGNFLIPQLDTGSYTVTAMQPGFKTTTINDVIIQIGREYTLKIEMAVGGVDTVVEVTAGASLVNVASGEVSTTITPRQIMDLPLNGRNPLQLMYMQAGSASNPSQNTSINGQRTAFTNITHDGINIQDAFIRSNATDFAPGRPTVDDTAEFTMVSQNATADQGGAAQIRLVTPRGTSSYRGSLYEFNRNSALAANTFFNNRSGVVRPFRNRNQLGGTFQGPVPVLSDKLFFFFNYEKLIDKVKSNRSRTILLPDARKGIFTYRDNSSQTRTINLFTLLPGVTGIDPTIEQRILSNLPTVGNAADIGDQLNTTGVRFAQGQNTNRDNYATRIDFDLNSRHTFNGVWAWNDEVNQRPDVDGTQGFGTSPVIEQSSTNRRFVAAWRWTPLARFTNEVRGGLFHSDVPFYRTQDPPDYYIVPGVISNPIVTFQNQGRKVRTYNVQDNAEWVRGRHAFRMGVVLQWFQVNPYNHAGNVPTWNTGTNANTPTLASTMFPGGISSAQLSTANSLMAMLSGIIGSGSQAFNVPNTEAKQFTPTPRLEDYRYENHSVYISNQWRARTDLTINLGLRWDLLTPARLLNRLLLEPVIPSGKTALETVLSPTGTYNYIGGNSGSKDKLHKTDWNNIAPVISAAWNPRFESGLLRTLLGDSRTVFRGGLRYSFVNDSILTSVRNAGIGNAGLSTTTVNALNPLTNTSALNARLNALPSIVAPTVMIPRTYADNNGPSFSNFGTVFLVNPELQVPRTMEYNFGIQRELGGNMVLEVRYVGSRSDNLNRSIDYNQIDIRDNGFAADFMRARRNLMANGNPTVGETLTVFPLLVNGGNLSSTTNRNHLTAGTVADLALTYIQQAQTGSVKFLPNPGTGVANLFTNGTKYRYNSLQIELRRRFSNGLFLLTNYSFQKNLTNGIGTSQTMVEPFLDNRQPSLEYTRADYDQTHVINFSNMYELPFGRNKAFLSGAHPVVSHLIGGWSINSIVRAGTGAPITFTDPRGTLNRAGRSGRQTPNTTLTIKEIKNLLGRFENDKGLYFINPSVTNPATGRAAEGFGTTPFAGQVFFNVDPGTTGYLGRAVINGPWTCNVDVSLLKNFRIREGMRLQIRAEAFNLLNSVYFAPSQTQDISSTSFGRVTGTAVAARVLQMGARLEF